MFKILCIVSIIATVSALGLGLVCLFKGGTFNKQYGNLAMRMRIAFQFISLALLYMMFH